MAKDTTITVDTARSALVRAALPVLGAGLPAVLFAPAGASGPAPFFASAAAVLGLAAAITAIAERVGDPDSAGGAAFAAGGVGAGLGAVGALQDTFLRAALRGGDIAAGMQAIEGLGAWLLPLAALGAIAVGVPLGVVVHHRLTLDPADRLAGTGGNTNAAIATSMIYSLPLLPFVPIAGVVAAVLLVGCWVDEQLTRRATRWTVREERSRLTTRVLRGDLPRERVELAAYAGHAGASEAGLVPFVPPDLRAWAEGLRVFGAEASLRAAVAGLGIAVPAHEREHPGDLRPRRVWEALGGRLERPGLEQDAALSSATAALGGSGGPSDAPALRAARAAADASSRAGALAALEAGRDAARALTAAAQATGDDAVVRAAACEALQAWALDEART